jgi:hypothetical protein
VEEENENKRRERKLSNVSKGGKAKASAAVGLFWCFSFLSMEKRRGACQVYLIQRDKRRGKFIRMKAAATSLQTLFLRNFARRCGAPRSARTHNARPRAKLYAKTLATSKAAYAHY